MTRSLFALPFCQRAARIAAVCACVVVAAPAFAHGGDDHGAAPPPPTAHSNQRSAVAQSERLMLVLRYGTRSGPGAVPLRALVADADSNAPVEGATVSVNVSDAKGQALPLVTLAATKSPGVYEGSVDVRAVDVDHAAGVTVVAGDLVDAVAVSGLAFGTDAAHKDDAGGVHVDGEGGAGRAVVVIVGALLLLAGVVIGRASAASKARAAATAIVFGVVVDVDAAFAHGGEDHDHGAAPARGAVSADVVFVPLESQFLLGVRTTRAVRATLADELRVPGVITAPPDRHAAVFAPQAGRVVVDARGLPALGSRVRRGQTLVVLEAALGVGERASFAVEAAQAEAEVSAARARLDAARAQSARLTSLAGVVARREREDAEVAVRDAEAQLALAEAKRAAYGTTTTSTRITLTAPLDGVVADLDVSPGEIVEPGRRAFLIVDARELWVEARVAEGDIARIGKNAAAVVVVDAYPRLSFAASLLAAGEVVDPSTRTVKAIFRVDNAAAQLKLGMFAQVAIGAHAQAAPAHDHADHGDHDDHDDHDHGDHGEHGDDHGDDHGDHPAPSHDHDDPVVVIPSAAVLDVDGRAVVFVRVGPERYARREVLLGRRQGDRVEVRAGLEAGERVAIASLLSLKNAAPAPEAPPR